MPQEALPAPDFFEAADRAVKLELEIMRGEVDEGEAGRTKKALWERMGRALEAAHWPPPKIAAKIARTIEEKVAKKTGVRPSVQGSHFRVTMAQRGWTDQRFRNHRFLGKASVTDASGRKPFIDRVVPDVVLPEAEEEEGATERQAAEPAKPEAAPEGTPAPKPKPKPKTNRPLNTELVESLRALADGLRWAARTIEDPAYKGAVDLAVEHPREYAGCVHATTALATLLVEEGARRAKVPATGYHLFRLIAGRGELSALAVCELFAAERLRLIKAGTEWLGKAVVRQFRQGRTPTAPPPILRPSGTDSALMLGWSGRPCLKCRKWRVDDKGDCADCGANSPPIETAAVCPECQALVYAPMPGAEKKNTVLKCRECRAPLNLTANQRRMLVASTA